MRSQQKEVVRETIRKIDRIALAVLQGSLIKDACRELNLSRRTYARYKKNNWELYLKLRKEIQ